MKADPEIREAVAKEIQEELDDLSDYIRTILDHLRVASTVEEIMECKKDILSIWIRRLPLGYDSCYFCIKNTVKDSSFVKHTNCDSCSYAVAHGKCNHTDSTYHKIREDSARLRSSIECYHSRGLCYGDD